MQVAAAWRQEGRGAAFEALGSTKVLLVSKCY